jgi:putative flippase GtrA
MKKNDLYSVTIIGAAVGSLIQPILANLSSISIFANPSFLLRMTIFLSLAVFAPFALWILYLIGKLIPVIYQFGKFAAVGVLNTFIDLGVLNLEIFLSGISFGLFYVVFKTVSFLCATTNSFFWNKYWTFNAKGSVNGKETGSFYLFAAIGWLLNVGIATFIVNVIGSPASINPKVWANIGALCGVGGAFLWDFLSYKFFVFKKSKTA